ncbi:Sulfotransferase family-containing protein [Strongyloides ratti]|uniref:Sulfotransferase family-containing protein n=1 Tax=Strongyloides ratti TaxID=34506 RepID=A0A090LM34_STRRB|nr:Sulfotransferase family-containing protein [Strongyloides ratti]CEF68620.1 Sulfotransferase family-containing protein [Strongyloides ratti]
MMKHLLKTTIILFLFILLYYVIFNISNYSLIFNRIYHLSLHKKTINCSIIDESFLPKNKLLSSQKVCIKPFSPFYPRFRVSTKYKINYCAIDKNFSTMMTAIICFLNNETKYILSGKHFKDEIFGRRSCGLTNEGTSIEELEKKFNKNDINGEWSYLAIIRNPIERFISGFVDKCVLNREWMKKPGICGGCKMDMKCFIEKIYDRMYRRSYNGERLNNFDDQHFFPQNWRCEFYKNFKKFYFIKYSSLESRKSNFIENLINYFKSKHIPKESINFIINEINIGRTFHSTWNSTDKIYFTNLLLNDNYLIDIFTKMYYYDFILFNFSLPIFKD